MQKNLDIRQEAKDAGVFLWEIADALGICDTHLSRKLRHEMPEAEKLKVKSAIYKIAEQHEREGA